MIDVFQQAPQYVAITIPERHYVIGWGGINAPVYSFLWDAGVFESKTYHSGIGNALGQYPNYVHHTLDPFTAVNLGLCTPEELGMPLALKALFNLIDPKGNF